MRKEVNISKETIETLQKLADKKKWSLKKLMEEILLEKATKEQNKNLIIRFL